VTNYALPTTTPRYDQNNETQTRSQIATALSAISNAIGALSLASLMPGTVLIKPSGDTTGATDTAAIQAAISGGKNVLLGPGVFYTNATLNLNSYSNCGQTVQGAGSYYSPGSVSFSTTPPPNTTVIRPVSGFTGFVFKIDGTPIGGAGQTWVQGVAIQNLAIDLQNVADSSSNGALWQAQAWDCLFTRVRVMNDGSSKVGFYFTTGAYTTTLQNCQSNYITGLGTSTANGVTTISVINHDGNNVNLQYCDNFRFWGGAFRGSGTRFYLRYCAAIQIQSDIEGSGTYLNVDSSVKGLWSQCELQNFSGAYMTGTAAPVQMLLDQKSNYNSYPFNFDFGHINLNNQGAASASTFYSGATGANYYLGVGRAQLETLLGTAAATNDFLSGTAAGDSVLSSWNGAGNLWLGAKQTPIAQLTTTGFNTFGAGTLNQGAVIIQPGSDTDVLTVKKAAGTTIFDIATNGTPQASVVNSANFVVYSDGFSTQKFTVNGANGNVFTAGVYSVGANQVVTARQTGWGAASGTLSRSAYASYAGQTFGATYTKAAAQATDDGLKALAQRVAALITDLTTHGLIGP
jgi:hypothetical protein